MDKEEQTQKLKWDEFKTNLLQKQKEIFENCEESDCILISTEGKQFKTHKIVLSSSSQFFYDVLKDVPSTIVPTIHIPDAETSVIESLLQFIYTGETSVSNTHLSNVLEMCNYLQIKGFVTYDCLVTGVKANSSDNVKEDPDSQSPHSEEYILIEECTAKDLIETQSVEDFSVEYLECDDYQYNGDDERDITNNATEAFEDDEDTLDDSNCANESSNEFEDLGIQILERNVDESDSSERKSKAKRRRTTYRSVSRNINSEIDMALSEVIKGKTIHQLSVEYNLPRSTLYQKFRNNENLKQNYRLERRSALDQAVRSVLEERLSLKKASDRFSVPKTAIWRELRKCHQYQPPTKEFTQQRQCAQNEILMGKSLTSISMKYGIPLTTLHRDKKRFSSEGKLPEVYRVKDRTENSEYGKRLEQALQFCRQGMSQYQAAKLFNIPKATMWRYAHALLKADKANVNKSEDE